MSESKYSITISYSNPNMNSPIQNWLIFDQKWSFGCKEFLKIVISLFLAILTQNSQQLEMVHFTGDILVINMVIRLFLFRRFLKNYTTNFDETLHIL